LTEIERHGVAGTVAFWAALGDAGVEGRWCIRCANQRNLITTAAILVSCIEVCLFTKSVTNEAIWAARSRSRDRKWWSRDRKWCGYVDRWVDWLRGETTLVRTTSHAHVPLLAPCFSPRADAFGQAHESVDEGDRIIQKLPTKTDSCCSHFLMTQYC
jgi:hypothetical protein